ncbi:hypothetical protein IKT64_00290 [Candidatus Saccharibacteria bacterium]|nr:hypothetical protein [Candidatus Saccharibacteria bacterium]
MRRLVIIDGKSVFYRGYYAMGSLALSDGTPTGGIYGFAAIAMEIVKRLNPSQVVVAWDSRTSSAKRKAIFADYKAGRVKPGDDFYAQIPLLKELIIDLGWDFIEVDEYEADDIIGTLSKQADETLGTDGKCEYETYIVSSDLDMLQIVDDNTKMYRILKGFSEIEEIDVKEVEAKYGILKSQFLDLKALKGDNSDNIPGVPGIGEKTAVKLLNEYGSVDGIYEHLDEIKGSTRDKLAAGKESAYMSLKLAQIMFDAPVSLSSVPEFEFNRERVIERLKKLQFNSLIRKFGLEGLQTAEPAKTEVKVEELPKDTVVAWDVKALMHEETEAATKILMGMPFWDLAQGAFLLDPLAREIEQKDVKIAYSTQKQAFLQRPELYKIFVQFDQPLIPVLFKMEKKGMLIDRDYFAKLKAEYTEEVARKEREIQLMAGVDFNVNSPVQLSEVLFDKMGLSTKGIKKTSRGYSTGAKELDKLRGESPIIEKLMEYREAAKLLSTYITPMPELADTEGRIHTTFTQNVTATGRLSSLNPNLQNIPVRTEEGKRIREGFVAPKGRVLVSADYSQFELRLAAVLSDDKALIDDFNAGIDIHTKTASEAFGVPLEQVTKAQRRAAKVINFGVLYGMSVKGLADAAGMSIGDAKAFIDRYFELRAPIKRKLEEILKQAREMGYVETFFGRRRPTPDVKSSNFLVRAAAERAAQNMPIQGTEADLMKRAMIEVDKKLPKGAELIMQVHDSLIVECDEALQDEVKKILKETMEGVAPELKIKLAVDVTVGHNWGEL